MIDPKHHEAIIANNNKLKKDNARLNAVIQLLKKDHDEFVKSTNEKVESVIRKYDKHNQIVLNYLKGIELGEEHLENVEKFFPIKLGSKNEQG